MNINISCEKCGDSLKVVDEYSENGDIEITVEPCEYCMECPRECCRGKGEITILIK